MGLPELSSSDRAVLQFKLDELRNSIGDMSTIDVCGTLVGLFCYAVAKSGGTLANAIAIVKQTWRPPPASGSTPRGTA